MPYSVIKVFITAVFSFSFLLPPGYAQSVLKLPEPSGEISLSAAYTPAQIKGIRINPQNGLQFDFLIDRGQTALSPLEKEGEYQRLIKYFLAALTIPEQDLWVNLSPYEEDRIIEDDLGATDLGRDLLAQDYLLKKMTASLISPRQDLGQAFWDQVYQRVYERYGETDIPVNTFNRVWIVPDGATVIESGNTAVIVESHLKVMLEEDYFALQSNRAAQPSASERLPEQDQDQLASLSSQIVREVILPALEQEINQGENFAPLRQVYASMILATWFKQALRESLLGQVYADRAKVRGIDLDDPTIKQSIYQRYLDSFKAGVADYIQKEYDPRTQEVMFRKYFVGGFSAENMEVQRLTAEGGSIFSSPVREAARRPEDRARLARMAEEVVSSPNIDVASTRMRELEEPPPEALTMLSDLNTTARQQALRAELDRFYEQIGDAAPQDRDQIPLPEALQGANGFATTSLRNPYTVVMREFLQNLGVTAGSRVMNVGTTAANESFGLGLGALTLGAEYVGFDLQGVEEIAEDFASLKLGDLGGAARQLGEFSSTSPDSRQFTDHSQDVIFMVSGVLSDFATPSDPVDVLAESLRLAKDGGKLVIGSLGSEAEVTRSIEDLLADSPWNGRVELIRLPEPRYQGPRSLRMADGRDRPITFSFFGTYEVRFKEEALAASSAMGEAKKYFEEVIIRERGYHPEDIPAGLSPAEGFRDLMGQGREADIIGELDRRFPQAETKTVFTADLDPRESKALKERVYEKYQAEVDYPIMISGEDVNLIVVLDTDNDPLGFYAYREVGMDSYKTIFFRAFKRERGRNVGKRLLGELVRGLAERVEGTGRDKLRSDSLTDQGERVARSVLRMDSLYQTVDKELARMRGSTFIDDKYDYFFIDLRDPYYRNLSLVPVRVRQVQEGVPTSGRVQGLTQVAPESENFFGVLEAIRSAMGNGYDPEMLATRDLAVISHFEERITRGDLTMAQILQTFLQPRLADFLKEPVLELPAQEVIRRIEKALVDGGQSVSSPASGTTGGIDLNAALLNLQIKRDPNNVPLPLQLQDLDNINIDGLVPVILNIAPASTLPGSFTLSKGE